jgi:hypothetical protein
VAAEPRELADLPYAAALTPHSGGLEAHAEYDTVQFGRAGFDDPDASGARFLECAFTGTSVVQVTGPVRRDRREPVVRAAGRGSALPRLAVVGAERPAVALWVTDREVA